jgi:ribonuclease P protein component
MGKKLSSSDFTLIMLPVERTGVRIGICVGKSLATAVKRNRLKRRIREIVQKIDFKNDGFDIVMVARRNILDKSFDDISNSINHIFNKAHLI